MAKGGNQAMTEADRKLSGVSRADRPFVGSELEPLEELTEPPKYLGPEARRTWLLLGRQMVREGVLMKTHLHALEAYCVVYAVWVRSAKGIERAPLTKKHGLGMVVNPAFANFHTSLKTLKVMQNELGLTPNSRRPPKSVAKKTVDPLTEDMGRQRHGLTSA